MGFKREIESVLRKSLLQGRSLLLLGPRQTGKTTLMEEVFSNLPQPKRLRYYFQLPSQREKIEEDPEVIKREVEALGSDGPVPIFIDEIQLCPKVMGVLQFLVDQKKILLAATGSSARRMRTLGANWLPGRILLEYLGPLSWRETGWPVSQLKTLLLYGSLPAILSDEDLQQREKSLASYSHLYLEEEIRKEAAVRNIPRFTKFLRLAALESGTSPNYSKIGTLVGLSHTMVREYFQILEDTLIVHRLDAFGSHRNAVLRTPRYTFFDLGVRNAASQVGHAAGLLTLQKGLLFENFVVLEAMALLKGRAQFYYWRSRKGHEVDLVLSKKGDILPIEIKATDKPSRGDFLGLEAFCKQYKIPRGFVVCQTEKRQAFGPHQAIPWFEMASLISD